MITIIVCVSTTKRAMETLECVQNRAMEMICQEDLWEKVKRIDMGLEIKLCAIKD